MTQIVNDAERISAALHHDFEHHEAPQGRPLCNLIHLMTNIIQQLEEYQPESDVGPALHAARQVAYWSSVFISMVSNNAATIPSSNLSNPAVFATPSSSQPTAPIPTSAFIPSSSSQPTFPFSTSVSISSTSSQFTFPIPASSLVSSAINQPTQSSHPKAFIPSASSQHTLPINTTAFISSTSSPPSLPISTSAFIPSASSQHTSPINTTGFISSTSNQPTQSMTTTTFIPSSINQPTLGTNRTAVVSSAVYQPTLSKHPTAFIQPTGNQPSLSIPATTLIPPSRTQPTWSNPTTVSVPPTMNQPLLSTATTDPATITMFTEYGSGSLSEWLDSLVIPRNIDNLQQVKDLWEVGTVNCPPLHKWTVVMRNNRSKTGKNSSMFSQRKYIYNLFKNCNFDENLVFAQYNELRPGKLYKILNTKSK